MQKLTKIVATIGPATDSEEMIEKLVLAGVNVFRFNFKHGTVEWHSERIERVNKVVSRLGVPIGTLIDLQGPEIRINMPFESIEVKKGDLLIFGEKIFEEHGDVLGFSITHPDIIQYLAEGQKILADDGSFTFHVVHKGDEIYLESESTGVLKQRKNLNIPGAEFPFPLLVDRDFDGLKLAARNEIDFVALSFVRTADDLRLIREEMAKHNVKGKLVAKIENQKAIDNLDAIIAESDAIMVARGDMGVELPIEQVPYYQKLMIKKCIERGIPVITATQMLQSMVEHPYPYRAEISDIANATYDKTDAVMLSAETASGLYPVEAVSVMAKTARFNERKLLKDLRKIFDYSMKDTASTVCDTAYNLYIGLRSKGEEVVGFLVFSKTGKSAQLISRYRPDAPIFSFSPDKAVSDMLTLNYGVIPFTQEREQIGEVRKNDVLNAVELLKEKEHVKVGQKVIVLHGDMWASEGGTSTIKVVEVK